MRVKIFKEVPHHDLVVFLLDQIYPCQGDNDTTFVDTMEVEKDLIKKTNNKKKEKRERK